MANKDFEQTVVRDDQGRFAVSRHRPGEALDAQQRSSAVYMVRHLSYDLDFYDVYSASAGTGIFDRYHILDFFDAAQQCVIDAMEYRLGVTIVRYSKMVTLGVPLEEVKRKYPDAKLLDEDFPGLEAKMRDAVKKSWDKFVEFALPR